MLIYDVIVKQFFYKRPLITTDVKRALGVLATMTPPGPTLHLCNVFQIVELRDQIMAGPSAPLSRSPSATRMSMPFLSHPRARASLLLATSNTLSPDTDILSVSNFSRHARAHTRTRKEKSHARSCKASATLSWATKTHSF